MKLQSMSIDQLTKLRTNVDAILAAKITDERRTVHEQLSKLDRLAASGSRTVTTRGGPRGAVPPKYRNPDNPAETWAGRGLKPRWLAAAIKAGHKIEDFSIDAAAARRPLNTTRAGLKKKVARK